MSVFFILRKNLVAQKGLEPLAQAYETRMFNQLHYRALYGGNMGIEPYPLIFQTNALTL